MVSVATKPVLQEELCANFQKSRLNRRVRLSWKAETKLRCMLTFDCPHPGYEVSYRKSAGQLAPQHSRDSSPAQFFIHSINKPLLNTYYVPSSVLGTWDTMVNKRESGWRERSNHLHYSVQDRFDCINGSNYWPHLHPHLLHYNFVVSSYSGLA